jgi:hypothetical protein
MEGTKFLVERRNFKTEELEKTYGPFPHRGLADSITRKAIEKYVGSVVSVIPIAPPSVEKRLSEQEVLSAFDRASRSQTRGG